MDEKYRLVFRGEILEGQHQAVVKRRLAELLKLDEARLGKLFSGQPVNLKRGVDKKTAARYQALFKQAGGRLRVQAEQQHENSQPEADKQGVATAAPAPPVPDKRAPDKEIPAKKAPEKASHSNTSSHVEDQPAAVAVPAYTVDANYSPPPAVPAPEIQAPDFAVAALGADILKVGQAPVVVVPEPDFELAEVGVDLVAEQQVPLIADIGPLDFEVADVGADLGLNTPGEPVAAPDVSHLALIER